MKVQFKFLMVMALAMTMAAAITPRAARANDPAGTEEIGDDHLSRALAVLEQGPEEAPAGSEAALRRAELKALIGKKLKREQLSAEEKARMKTLLKEEGLYSFDQVRERLSALHAKYAPVVKAQIARGATAAGSAVRSMLSDKANGHIDDVAAKARAFAARPEVQRSFEIANEGTKKVFSAAGKGLMGLLKRGVNVAGPVVITGAVGAEMYDAQVTNRMESGSEAAVAGQGAAAADPNTIAAQLSGE